MPTVLTIAQREALASQANTTPQLETWSGVGRCARMNPEMFSAEADKETRKKAARACAQCPLMTLCRARRYEAGAEGTWGGVYYGTPSGRIAAPRTCARKGCTKPPHHYRAQFCGFECGHAVKAGTVTGRNLHQKHHVPMCGPCSDAWRLHRERAGHIDPGAQRFMQGAVTRDEAHRIPSTTRKLAVQNGPDFLQR